MDAERQKPSKLIVPIVIAIAVVAIVSTIMTRDIWLTGLGIRQDTGVAACEAMSRAAEVKEAPEPTPEKWRQARDQFEQSKYADIQSAGTDFVDRAQEMSDAPQENMMLTALTVLPAMTDAFNRLDVACNKHGHDLPAFSSL